MGLGAYLVRKGNPRGELILRDAAAGELFGFGISEPGNDLVLFGSTSAAVPDGGGRLLVHRHEDLQLVGARVDQAFRLLGGMIQAMMA